MKKTILNLMESYPIQSGAVLLAIGVILMIYQINKRNSFRMGDHNVISWKALISVWTLIVILILFGLALVIRGLNFH